jgi:hypothetical protein
MDIFARVRLFGFMPFLTSFPIQKVTREATREAAAFAEWTEDEQMRQTVSRLARRQRPARRCEGDAQQRIRELLFNALRAIDPVLRFLHSGPAQCAGLRLGTSGAPLP